MGSGACHQAPGDAPSDSAVAALVCFAGTDRSIDNLPTTPTATTATAAPTGPLHPRLVHPVEWKSFSDQLDTLRELKEFLTKDGVLSKVRAGRGRRPDCRAGFEFPLLSFYFLCLQQHTAHLPVWHGNRVCRRE